MRFRIGMLFSYIAYRELLAARVMNVLDKYLEMKTIEIHLDRLSDIVMAPPESSGDVRTLPPSSTQALGWHCWQFSRLSLYLSLFIARWHHNSAASKGLRYVIR